MCGTTQKLRGCFINTISAENVGTLTPGSEVTPYPISRSEETTEAVSVDGSNQDAIGIGVYMEHDRLSKATRSSTGMRYRLSRSYTHLVMRQTHHESRDHVGDTRKKTHCTDDMRG